LFPCAPAEQRARDRQSNHPWTDDQSPGDWWLNEPLDLHAPDPDPDADPDADADVLRSVPHFTSLEHQLHHALCA
ncbi:MAG: hypothetical protein WCP28_20265, partial [Actinomycetes bacterium]